jgi:MFS family permease
MTTETSNQSNVLFNPNLHIIFSVTLVAIMGVSSLTPAFPKMGQAFKAAPSQISWLITVFTLPGVFLTPVLGVLADRWGRKQILIPSLVLFGIAGTTCFFLRDFNWLLFARFFQGIGAAALGSLNVTLIGDLFSGKTRTTAMGYNASVLSIGTASFPLVGGALAGFGWHFPFLLPGFAILVSFGVLFRLQNPAPNEKQKLTHYFSEAWKNIKNRHTIGLFLISVMSFIIVYGAMLTYLPFLLNQRFQLSPLKIGLILSSSSLSTALTAAQVGKLSHRFSEKQLLKIGFLLYAAGMLIIPFVTTVWLMLIPTLIFGMGSGLNFPTVQTLLAAQAPINQRAMIMSLNGMVLRLGQTLGPLLMAFFFSLLGINSIYFVAAGFALLLLLTSSLFLRE